MTWKRRDTPRPYVRIDNDLGSDEKLLDIAEEHYLPACGLHVLAIGYCDRKRTDGFVSRGALRRLAPDIDGELVAEMVRVGLWLEVDGGHQIENYLTWQKSRAEIEDLSAKRSAAAAASWPREKAQAEGTEEASCTASCNADTDTDSTSDTEKDKTKSLSVSTDGIPDDLIGYWSHKAGREPTASDIRSFKTMLYSLNLPVHAVKEAIGQAVVQGERADNFALVTHIAKGQEG